MRILFVSEDELFARLAEYGWFAHRAYGAYFPGVREILVNKESIRAPITVIHEMVHWFMELLGLRKRSNIDAWFDILTHFLDLTMMPRDKLNTVSFYWARMKRPHKVRPRLSAWLS